MNEKKYVLVSKNPGKNGKRVVIEHSEQRDFSHGEAVHVLIEFDNAKRTLEKAEEVKQTFGYTLDPALGGYEVMDTSTMSFWWEIKGEYHFKALRNH